MKVLSVKVNTTGLDLSKDSVFDIGLVMYDTDTKCPIDIYSAFVDIRGGLKGRSVITDSQNHYNLTEDYIGEVARPTEDTILVATRMIDECDFVISCNGREYDRSFLNRLCTSFNCSMPRKVWVDIRYDVDFPKTCTNRSLAYLEAFHGFVNPFRGRCVFDCMSILKIAEIYGFCTILETAKSPMVTLSAKGYMDKSSCNLNGFYWNSEYNKYTKIMKSAFITDEYINSLSFEVDVENVEDVID